MQRALARDAGAPVHVETRLRTLARVALGNSISLSRLLKQEANHPMLHVTDGEELNSAMQRPYTEAEDGIPAKAERNLKPLWWEGWHGTVTPLDFSVHPVFPIINISAKKEQGKPSR